MKVIAQEVELNLTLDQFLALVHQLPPLESAAGNVVSACLGSPG
jgi:hypothetical protein